MAPLWKSLPPLAARPVLAASRRVAENYVEEMVFDCLRTIRRAAKIGSRVASFAGRSVKGSTRESKRRWSTD